MCHNILWFLHFAFTLIDILILINLILIFWAIHFAFTSTGWIIIWILLTAWTILNIAYLFLRPERKENFYIIALIVVPILTIPMIYPIGIGYFFLMIFDLLNYIDSLAYFLAPLLYYIGNIFFLFLTF